MNICHKSSQDSVTFAGTFMAAFLIWHLLPAIPWFLVCLLVSLFSCLRVSDWETCGRFVSNWDRMFSSALLFCFGLMGLAFKWKDLEETVKVCDSFWKHWNRLRLSVFGLYFCHAALSTEDPKTGWNQRRVGSQALSLHSLVRKNLSITQLCCPHAKFFTDLWVLSTILVSLLQPATWWISSRICTWRTSNRIANKLSQNCEQTELWN